MCGALNPTPVPGTFEFEFECGALSCLNVWELGRGSQGEGQIGLVDNRAPSHLGGLSGHVTLNT